ncbi:MAG: hypothetical protein Q9221_004897 [Calogaya cf. arnoldii]
MPQHALEGAAPPEVMRVPLLPYNDSATGHEEADESVIRPQISLVSANSTHIESPSAMSEVTDNHAVHLDPFDLTNKVTAAASKIAEVPMEKVREASTLRQLWTGFVDDMDNSYDFVAASPPTQTNSAGIHNDGTDFSYFTSVEFGSSGKFMHLLVDTGASNTWVMASDCNSAVCAAHNTFGKEHSASLKVSQDKFNLTYGTGSVSGLKATDTVKLAGFSISLPFGLAHTISEDFMSYPIDGILRLGPPTGKSTDYPTFMETIQETNLLSSKLFGVNLQRSSDGATDGELSFGAPDTSKYQGDLSYTSVIKGASMWEIPIAEIKVNGSLYALSIKTAIIDTGTSFMLLPPADAKQIHSGIPGPQEDGEAFNIPCLSKTPIQLKFSEVLYNISPADYVGSPIEDGSSTCTSNILG